MRHNPKNTRNQFLPALFAIYFFVPAGFLTSLSAQAPGYDEVGNSWMEKIHGKTPAGESSAEQSKEEGDNPSKNENAENNSGSLSPQERNSEELKQLLPPEEEAPSFVGTLFRFVLMMGFMIALLYVLLRYLKNKSGGLAFGAGGLVEVIATAPLMQGKSIQIVDVAGRIYVLGVSDSGVNLITSIEDARSADKIRMFQSQKKDIVPQGLLTELTSLIKKSDYRFWHSEKEKDTDTSQDFRKILEKETAAEFITEKLPEKPPEETEAELTELLSRQRRKIANLKHKKN